MWIDLTGYRYGKLLVLRAVTREEAQEQGLKYENDLWLCQCDCGKQCIASKENLRGGNKKSCGCFQEKIRRINMKKAIHFVEGTCVERIAYPGKPLNNTTGHRGVYRRDNNRWRASIGFQGKQYNLGTYSTFEEAVAARKAGENRLYKPFLESYYRTKEKNAHDTDHNQM